jgi:hypothetical protein
VDRVAERAGGRLKTYRVKPIEVAVLVTADGASCRIGQSHPDNKKAGNTGSV